MDYDFDNAVIIRRRDEGRILKGISDDVIASDNEKGIEIFVLVKGDGEKVKKFEEELRRCGIMVEFEVLPCG